jgi:predicted nuclease with TOPRIM domain
MEIHPKKSLKYLNSLSKMQSSFLFFMSSLQEYIEENKNIKKNFIDIKSQLTLSQREIETLEKDITKLKEELKDEKIINLKNGEVLLQHISSLNAKFKTIKVIFSHLSNIIKIEGVNLEEHIIKSIDDFDKLYKPRIFTIKSATGSKKNIKRRKPKSRKPKSKKR